MLQTKSISSGLFPWKLNYVRGYRFAIFKEGKLFCVIQLERSGKEKTTSEYIFMFLTTRESCQRKTGFISENRMLSVFSW